MREIASSGIVTETPVAVLKITVEPVWLYMSQLPRTDGMVIVEPLVNVPSPDGPVNLTLATSMELLLA